ncbi:hypothetical protein PSTG_01353 [Puccinia striiformis f. sp. tritici PST-78]|uniref:HAT C-terminal dimerisation domain-containing protein n=1 Tax=Puccinia striiformis f. sp. tritici PST-78 TaxID=1165861 RepID=A0A0L0W250_9BASI|nr:hypothetical protein PSTG_01353 [Puccinia striiformis f. sp. tritici PST-78]
MSRRPHTQKRNRRKSPSPSNLSTAPSNPNTQPPGSDDQMIDDQANLTQTDNPSTSQTSTTGTREATDQEELARARRTAENAVSSAYSTYHPPELSNQLDKKGRRMIAYPCKMCGVKINRPTTDSSCSNLLRHQASCLHKQNEAGSSNTLAAAGISGTGDIDRREVPQLCAIWCAEAARPFSALADASHQMILHPTVVKNLPSDKVLSRSVHMLYTAVQDTLRKTLINHDGAMYIGADAWQSPNGFDILGVVIYCLVELAGGKFKLEAMPLDFVRLAKSHTGEYLADTIRVVVEKFQIQNKICGIVTDNASNNLVMVSEMKKFKWARFKGDQHWIRCYAHILNLIAQSILRPFDGSGGEEAEDQICRFDNDVTHSTHSGDEDDTRNDNETIQPDILEPELTLEDINNLSDEDEENDLYTTAMCKQSLAKFRAVARKLRKSPNSKMEFVELCREMECEKPHSIYQDVRTRWNSTLDQLVSIVRCHKAITVWQKDKKHGLDRKYHILHVDIQLAKHLISILQVFYEQTLQVSTSGSARLTHIIVFIDEVTELLSNAIARDGSKYPPALRNACRVGLQLTNKYYTLSDCSPLYRIAMVLHPSFKDEYFKIAGWEKDWIAEALRLTWEMFNTYYKPSPSGQPSTNPHKVTKPKTGNLAQLGAAQAARVQSANDPLDVWLASGLLLDDGSPINALTWWIQQKRAGNTHGGLLQMALDVLSCPATSVDVERAFSFGRNYVTQKRHRLNSISVTRGMSMAFYSKNKLIEPGLLRKWKDGLNEEKEKKRKRNAMIESIEVD